MKDLETCRKEIDAIDQQIMELFEKRMNVGKDVVEYKKQHHLPIFQPLREKEVIHKNVNRLKNKALEQYAHTFIQNMMNVSKSYQSSFIESSESFVFNKEKTSDLMIGYQGVKGAFSDEAVSLFFNKETNRKNYESFEDVFKALENDEIDYGVVPVENSSTGMINDNYDFITEYQFYIVGEVKVNIQQHLLGIKGSTIEDLKEVYTHRQGILQTTQFFKDYPFIKVKEYTNTAAAAKYISLQNDQTLGAIASYNAARTYDLEILKENIQNQKSNTTRFIVFSKQLENRQGETCVSFVFSLNHEIGALYEIMKIINNYQLNMIRIESRPIKDTPFEYYFYVDVEGTLEDHRLLQAIAEIKIYTNTFRVLGNYIKK